MPLLCDGEPRWPVVTAVHTVLSQTLGALSYLILITNLRGKHYYFSMTGGKMQFQGLTTCPELQSLEAADQVSNSDLSESTIAVLILTSWHSLPTPSALNPPALFASLFLACTSLLLFYLENYFKSQFNVYLMIAFLARFSCLSSSATPGPHTKFPS